VPTVSDVEESRIRTFIKKISVSIKKGKNEKYLPLVEQIMEEEECTSPEIAAALIMIHFEGKVTD